MKIQAEFFIGFQNCKAQNVFKIRYGTLEYKLRTQNLTIIALNVSFGDVFTVVVLRLIKILKHDLYKEVKQTHRESLFGLQKYQLFVCLKF
jgi:hypothetical protein